MLSFNQIVNGTITPVVPLTMRAWSIHLFRSALSNRGGLLNKRVVVSQTFYSNSTRVGISSRRGTIFAPPAVGCASWSHVGLLIYM